MGLYKVGLFLHDPLQLQDRQVVAAALGMEQRLVILFMVWLAISSWPGFLWTSSR